MTDSVDADQYAEGTGPEPRSEPHEVDWVLRDAKGIGLSQETLVAYYQAGRAVFAISLGMVVNRVDILPQAGGIGQVVHEPLPLPTEEGCDPGSLWLDTSIRLALAGDRAVRLVSPYCESAMAGRHSDFAQALALITAAYSPVDVLSALDQHGAALDAFFQSGEVRGELDVVAEGLLASGHLAGDELRQLLNRQKCGVKSPDGAHSCRFSPHAMGGHLWFEPTISGSMEHATWEGFELPDQLPVARHTARWKRVLRVLEPGVPPVMRNPERRDP